MAEPFLGEVRLMSFNFPPKGWALCNGQLLPINQNQALFSILGTTFGGDGRVNFALPDLRGRVPVHWGNGGSAMVSLGERAGEEFHTVSQAEMPTHNHWVNASSTASDAVIPSILAQTNNLYGPFTNATTLGAATISNTGGSQPHENRQPYAVISFCVALQGIFPSPT
jgi:microcystin-dependent protein